ncbi:MAG: hypothetical protein SOR11_07410 [Fusobacterium sp.]|uniref:hypothetical protein n=1 Tax=Fusobacterium sp. TaxID=68766 RepID=UPI002A74E712|nr:hypothetical protein [Fusobacterium sp.]MCF2639394.1 hypothetical protein [Fusobacterium varium]MDY3059809.1 hypothetical protein [Fusobacterium sp.]
MKVKFLRIYGQHSIGSEAEIKVDEKEKQYLLSTGTILVLADDITEEIPIVDAEEEKPAKNGRKKNAE